MPASVKDIAAKINRTVEERRTKWDSAKASASKVAPWLGLHTDRKRAWDSLTSDQKAFLTALNNGKAFFHPNTGGPLNFEKVQSWLDENPDLVTPEFLFKIAAIAFKLGQSQVKRMQASAKNMDARAWVLAQWHARTDTGQKKASFARQHAALVKKQFDLDVTPDTIARDWLPKGS